MQILFLLLLLISTSSATHFLFGVNVKCDLDIVFEFTIKHRENGGTFLPNSDFTEEMTLSARKHLFFYQKGSKSMDFGLSYEPYAVIKHNCNRDGSIRTFRKDLWQTVKSHGLEYMEYSINLTDQREF
uniref:S-protein homolog n=1 Tax=Caenorhabditis tropicalis TaxID=1561998 RepID=A0A1I7UJK8_9PELO